MRFTFAIDTAQCCGRRQTASRPVEANGDAATSPDEPRQHQHASKQDGKGRDDGKGKEDGTPADSSSTAGDEAEQSQQQKQQLEDKYFCMPRNQQRFLLPALR